MLLVYGSVCMMLLTAKGESHKIGLLKESGCISSCRQSQAHRLIGHQVRKCPCWWLKWDSLWPISSLPHLSHRRPALLLIPALISSLVHLIAATPHILLQAKVRWPFYYCNNNDAPSCLQRFHFLYVNSSIGEYLINRIQVHSYCRSSLRGINSWSCSSRWIK